jgi:hypothetical protein
MKQGALVGAGLASYCIEKHKAICKTRPYGRFSEGIQDILF